MNTCFLVTIGNVPPRTPATQLHSFSCHSGGQNVCCEVDEGMESTTQVQVGSGRYSSWEVRSVFYGFLLRPEKPRFLLLSLATNFSLIPVAYHGLKHQLV